MTDRVTGECCTEWMNEIDWMNGRQIINKEQKKGVMFETAKKTFDFKLFVVKMYNHVLIKWLPFEWFHFYLTLHKFTTINARTVS